ncbi:MAG: hypothetical protein HRU07_05870 [Nitrosopumilus sp.]|nr:hypothetical protein [Nitrosopumilus sp.]
MKATIDGRKKGVETELLFFAIFCDIMDNAQSRIYKVFSVILNDTSNLFPHIKKEALLLNRNVMIFGESQFDALRDLAKTHPSEAFAEFIRGYLTSQSQGGRDTGDYLAEKTRELQVSSRQKMTAYIGTSDSITQMVSFGLMFFPMGIVMGSMMISGSVLFLLTIFGIIFIPPIMIVMIMKINSIQPFMTNALKFRKEPVIISGIVFVIAIILGLGYWEITGLPLFVWSLSNYLLVRHNFRVNSKVDKAVPQFIRDMNQSMISTPSFFKSFQQIEKRNSYTPDFNKILREIKMQTVLGDQLYDVMQNIKLNSWLAKLVINLLSFTAKSGVITPNIMNKLALFSSYYLESKKEMLDKTSTAVMMGYMGPIIVVTMVLIMPSVDVTSIVENVDDISEIELDDSLRSLNSALVVIVSFFSLMVVSKIRYLTIYHSLHTAIIVAIVCLMFYYDKFVGINL